MSDLPVHDTPEDAEAAFYEAFEAGDADAMMGVWHDDDSIVCIHPAGARLVGREAVRESWQRIFAAGAVMRFELGDCTVVRDEALSVHFLTENIAHGPQLRLRGKVLATNVYRLTEFGWRMVAHHASPPGDESEEEIAPDPGARPKRLH